MASSAPGPRRTSARKATPVWVPVDDLPGTPLWPKRLGWRIAHWYRQGRPDRPAVLSDSLYDLNLPCDR